MDEGLVEGVEEDILNKCLCGVMQTILSELADGNVDKDSVALLVMM